MNVWGTESRGYHIFGRTLLTAVLAVFFLGHTVSANESVTIKVGVYQNPPKIYREKDGSIQGFWPQLLDHMAENNGWKIEYVPCKWAGCLELLKNGGIDLMPDVAYTQKRAQLFDFSNPTVFVS